MIIEIPQEKDFQKIALSLVNLAWESALELALSLDEAQENGVDVEEELFWRTSQTKLATAMSLVQQAFEFFLKSRIVAVSPLLLISGTAKNWPNGCDKDNTPFSSFYTIDAQELIRTHDTVASARLPEIVKTKFEELRRKRNSIIHTVDKKLTIEVREIVVAILEITDHFLGSCSWIGFRRQHLAEAADCFGYDSDGTTYSLALEIPWVVNALEPAQIVRFFGFNKKQRSYVCPSCWYECREGGMEPRVAYLIPKNPDSVNLHCYLCNQNHPVIREDCAEDACKGNVLGAGSDVSNLFGR